jgi:hypothetical protein
MGHVNRVHELGTHEMGHVNRVHEVGTPEMTKPPDLPVTDPNCLYDNPWHNAQRFKIAEPLHYISDARIFLTFNIRIKTITLRIALQLVFSY